MVWGRDAQGGLREGRKVREVVGDEVDGPDGPGAHVNGHVLLHAHPTPAHQSPACHGAHKQEVGAWGNLC